MFISPFPISLIILHYIYNNVNIFLYNISNKKEPFSLGSLLLNDIHKWL